MWVLRRTPDAAGRQRFGGAFRSYETLVDSHADDLKRLHCAVGLHAASALFVVYHRLLVREFEAALRAVDETLNVVPAWHPLERPGVSLFDTTLRGARPLLGSAPGDARRGYVIADGPFAMWPVSRRDGVTAFDMPNYVVRYSSCACEAVPKGLAQGVLRRYCGQAVDDSELARRWSTCASDAVAEAPLPDGFLACAVRLHAEWHRAVGGAVSCDANTTHLAVPGDFENGRTSVNDPVFFFVHAAFDVLFDAYRERHDALRPAGAPDAVDKLWAALRLEADPCARQDAWRRHRYAHFLGNATAFRDLFLDAHSVHTTGG